MRNEILAANECPQAQQEDSEPQPVESTHTSLPIPLTRFNCEPLPRLQIAGVRDIAGCKVFNLIPTLQPADESAGLRGLACQSRERRPVSDVQTCQATVR